MKKTYRQDEKGYIGNKTWWSVEKNNVLIKLNKLTGEATICGPGLHFLMPGIIVGKEINIADKNSCYQNVQCKSKDDYELTIDIDIVTRVTDAIKMEFASSNPDEILGAKLESIMRRFVASKDYHELSEMKFDLNASENSWIRDVLNDFESNYGLEITQMTLKKVKLPKELEDDFQKKIIQARENERKLAEIRGEQAVAAVRNEIKMVEAQGDRAVAEVKAETKKIDLSVENQIISDLVTSLKKRGFTAEQITAIVAAQIYSNSNGNITHIVGASGGEIQNAATTASIIEAPKTKTK